MRPIILLPFLIACLWCLVAPAEEEGAYEYKDFDKPSPCWMCHKEIFREWEQSMMSKCFTHPWDEVEYFRLALPQALKLEKVAPVKSGCVGCHAPLAFLAGDIPPKRPAEGTRANEGVSCDVCHTMVGSSEEEPFNFSYLLSPGKVKYGQRKKWAASSFHATAFSEFQASSELCATCHDEQSPYGAWVKSTYREWKAGPYGRRGVRCQDCHMHHAPGRSVSTGKPREDVAHHNFHGAHAPGKLAGAVDLAIYPGANHVAAGGTLKISVHLFNGKVGHDIPSGSSEERMLWLEVSVEDAKGKVHRLPVDRKGFEGEAYTIADPDARAYQAMGEIMEIEDFEGLSRDGDVPAGCRIFRRPFFDPQGRMTICQWYTAKNERIDYRIGPRETIVEHYTWKAPGDLAPGPVILKAEVFYSLVPASVGRFLKLPEEEYAPVRVNAVSVEMEAR